MPIALVRACMSAACALRHCVRVVATLSLLHCLPRRLGARALGRPGQDLQGGGGCWLQRTAVTSGICFASIVLEGILTRVITHSFRRRAYRGYVHYIWDM